jgi:S1-C subfamily serine protease
VNDEPTVPPESVAPTAESPTADDPVGSPTVGTPAATPVADVGSTADETPTVAAPPPPPGPAPTDGGGARPSGWRQFVVGALVGALVGGGTAAGVALATREDPAPTKTVVVGASSRPVRNSSVINRADDVQSVLEKVNDGVVAIQTGGAVDSGLFNGNGSGNGSGGAGTGFVISADGVIVTNSHVVEGANGRIEVEFRDGTKLAAELLGQSPEFDLAVLKVDAKNLHPVKLGSSDDLQVGDSVIAVGNALALEGGLSVTQGIVSGKGRVVPESETGQTLYDMLQTDAAINPGNSGGPLVNAAGEVIGINTALAGNSQNVGFAISIDSATDVIQMLRQGKDVRVAFLGVETSAVTPAIVNSLHLTTRTGAFVRNVTSGSGADRAGIKADDVIVAIGDRAVSGPPDVGAEVRRYRPGDTIEVTVERGGKNQTFSVTLQERPDRLG